MIPELIFNYLLQDIINRFRKDLIFVSRNGILHNESYIKIE